MSMKVSNIILTLVSTFSILHQNLVLADPPDAIIYENEDKTGNHILHYYDIIGGYYDLQSIVNQYRMEKIGLLCARGVFVLYNNIRHLSNADDDTLILAGDGAYTCINPGYTLSALAVQGFTDHRTDTLTIFKGERFTVPFEIINEPRSANDFRQSKVQMFGDIKSFILMGKSSWTIETRSYTFCLKPGLDSEFPVCPVAYSKCLTSTRDISTWLSAKPGCSNVKGMKELVLDFCFNAGSGHVESVTNGSAGVAKLNLSPKRHAGIGASITDQVQKPVTVAVGTTVCEDETHGEEFAVLTKIRITHDFESLYQTQFPLSKIHSWRTEILDNTIEIVASCTTDEIVNDHFLRILREFYIYLIEKIVWSKLDGWPTNKPTQRMLHIAQETRRCISHLSSKNWATNIQQIGDEVLSRMTTPGFKANDIAESLRTNKEYDFVSEFVWMMINFAGAACHAALEFETDFWMDYMNVAYDMYLVPMVNFWGNPDPIYKNQYYPVILGGYDAQRQFQGLAASTTLLYKTVTLDKLPRPEGVAAAATQDSNIPANSEVKTDE